MARFHNLKAQEAERTHQFSWKSKVWTTAVMVQYESRHRRLRMTSCNEQLSVQSEKGKNGAVSTYHDHLCSCKSRQTR